MTSKENSAATPTLTLQQLKTSLKESRAAHKTMNVKKLAKVTGLSERTIRRYADPCDPTRPDFHAVAVVALHFGESLDYVIRAHLDEPPSPSSDRVRSLVDHLLVNMTDEQVESFYKLLIDWVLPATTASNNTPPPRFMPPGKK